MAQRTRTRQCQRLAGANVDTRGSCAHHQLLYSALRVGQPTPMNTLSQLLANTRSEAAQLGDCNGVNGDPVDEVALTELPQ